MSREHACDVAIFAPRASGLYVDGGGRVAGAERQAGYLGNALAARGLRVRHIIHPITGGRRLRDDTGPVEPFVMHADRGDRRLARYRGILSALAAVDARLYVQVCASYETGVVGAWSRLHRRPFIFRSSSDADFTKDAATARMTEWGLELRRARLLYRIGLSAADRIVVMTETARELAREVFGIDDARLIRLFAEVPPEPVPSSREAFLWVGGLINVKNPFAYLELARRVPEATFWMVGAERFTGQEVVARVRAEAPSIPNLTLLPSMSADEILTLYDRAVAVVSTSFVEGFGNVLLESWARGVPVLSLRYDPDGVIERHELGAVCHGSLDELAEAARRLWADHQTIEPRRYRAYVERFHDPAVVGAQWNALVSELLDG